MIPKHEPPRTCRWRRALLGASPSAIFSTCLLGLRQTRKACKGCEANVAELIQEGFAEGLSKEAAQTCAKYVDEALEKAAKQPHKGVRL